MAFSLTVRPPHRAALEPMETPHCTTVGSHPQPASLCNVPSAMVARGNLSLMNVTLCPIKTLSSMVRSPSKPSQPSCAQTRNARRMGIWCAPWRAEPPRKHCGASMVERLPGGDSRELVLLTFPISFLPLISAESNGVLAARFGFPEGSREAVPNPSWQWRMAYQGREVLGA